MIVKKQFVRLATNIFALGITLLTAAGCGPATPPSDASIIARFNAHRAEFSQLLKCLIMTESTFVSDARIPRMTREVRSLSLNNVGPSDHVVSRRAPTPIVETTDGYRWTQMDHQRGAVELYRHIDGPWYLGHVAN